MPSNKPKTKRQKMIAKIHILKNKSFICTTCDAVINQYSSCPACHTPYGITTLPDFEYRNILKYLTGKSSCTEMTDAELIIVGKFFQRVSSGYSILKEHQATVQRMAVATKARANAIMGPSANWRLNAYCQKRFATTDLNCIGLKGLHSVNGFLSMLEKKAREEQNAKH